MPKNSKLAVLGPAYTFSDIAADKYLSGLKGNFAKLFTADIEEVFEMVEKGKAVFGIIPIENSTHGTVRESFDHLFERGVQIVGELKIPIHHYLVGLPKSKKSAISTIISHSQALSQCKNYLKKNYPLAEKEAVSSTAKAIEKLFVGKSPFVAAIVSAPAARKNKLKILAKNIEDDSSNSTRFFVIKKGLFKASSGVQKKCSKVSIAFLFSKDKPGQLLSVLSEFSAVGINLTKIESRPSHKKAGQYIFFVDFGVNPTKKSAQTVLKNIAKKVAQLKILGEY